MNSAPGPRDCACAVTARRVGWAYFAMRPSSRVFPIATLVALAALLPACRSAAPSARPGAAPPLSFLGTYIGQQRIALNFSDARRLAFARQDAARRRDGCDLAVELRDARLDAGTLSLRLEVLGRPRVEGQPARKVVCRPTQREVDLVVSGFAGSENADAVQSLLDQVLPTPEGYLKTRGVTFEPKAPLASADPIATPEQQSLWRKLTSPPRMLLRVDAEWHDPAHKVHHEGEIEFTGIVGTHGRLRDVRVSTPLSSEQEAHVRRALSFWRCDPARTKDGAVAGALNARLVLKID
jgi:hypothetical protein